jgi:hypothetical protein
MQILLANIKNFGLDGDGKWQEALYCRLLSDDR